MSPVFRRPRSLAAAIALASVALATSSPSMANLSHRDTDTQVGTAGLLRIRLLCDNVSATAECARSGDERQDFRAGQVVPASFGDPIGFAQLNRALRAQYHLDEQPDYVFTRGYLYVIDHRTRAVQRVIPVVVAH